MLSPAIRPFLQAAGGVAALCALDAAVKSLSMTHTVFYAVLGRYVAGSAFALAVWWLQGRPPITREMLPSHLARGLLIVATASMFFYALTVLTMAETITLSFTAPLMIPPLAQLLLGEKMRGPVLIAAALGFCGVLVTVQGAPAFSGSRALALASVLGASLTYALAAIVMRSRAASDGSTLLTLTGAIIPMLVLAPTAIGAPVPSVEAIGWCILAGVFGNLGIQLLARAYAQAEVQALGVIEFTALPWAAMFGWLLFGETVRLQVFLGATIIVAACIWAARAGRTQPAPLAP